MNLQEGRISFVDFDSRPPSSTPSDAPPPALRHRESGFWGSDTSKDPEEGLSTCFCGKEAEEGSNFCSKTCGRLVTLLTLENRLSDLHSSDDNYSTLDGAAEDPLYTELSKRLEKLSATEDNELTVDCLLDVIGGAEYKDKSSPKWSECSTPVFLIHDGSHISDDGDAPIRDSFVSDNEIDALRLRKIPRPHVKLVRSENQTSIASSSDEAIDEAPRRITHNNASGAIIRGFLEARSAKLVVNRKTVESVATTWSCDSFADTEEFPAELQMNVPPGAETPRHRYSRKPVPSFLATRRAKIMANRKDNAESVATTWSCDSFVPTEEFPRELQINLGKNIPGVLYFLICDIFC